MSIHKFAFPTTIHFGPGARKLVAENLAAAGCTRPLIVTDRGIAELPLLAEFRSHISGLNAGLFSGVQGNPVAWQVTAGADAYRAHGADSVIGFGGGAALDVAKAVALMAVHPGSILEYAWNHPSPTIYMQISDSYEKQGEFKKALLFHRKAEMFEQLEEAQD